MWPLNMRDVFVPVAHMCDVFVPVAHSGLILKLVPFIVLLAPIGKSFTIYVSLLLSNVCYVKDEDVQCTGQPKLLHWNRIHHMDKFSSDYMFIQFCRIRIYGILA